MKQLAVLLLTLAVTWTSANSENTESTNKSTSEELLKRAALQLERLSSFRRTRAPQLLIPEIPLEDNASQTTAAEVKIQEDILETQKRIDDLRASASAVLRDPRYAAIMQDRTKRSFISGIANKLIGGAVGAVSGLSRGVSGLSSSNTPSENGPYGHSYESQFNIWDFKKAIINTLIQAIKAIGGGAIAGGGALVKGGGYLVTAKGRLISSAGDAITSLGKSLASSAIIASPKPVYGPPGYAYNHHSIQQPGLDHAYDGPPPNEDAYAGPEDAYNADHSSYASPSNDDGVDNDAGILIVKETKPGLEHNQEQPSHSTVHDNNPNIAALEESFGGPPKGTSTLTKIIGILNSGRPTTGEQHHNQHQEEHVNYYQEHKDHEQPSNGHSLEANYESVSHHNNQENVNNNNYQNYQTNGQAYDSYGTKLEPSSHQLTGGHTEVHQPGQDHQQSLTLQIQGVLNPNLDVPKVELSTDFRNPTPFTDYNYDGNQHLSEPLKIPILDDHNNHLDHQSHDHQQIGALDYYGNPSYGSGAQAISTMFGPNADASSLPILPHYENYQLNSPMSFGQQLHYPAPGGPAVLGVWGRMSRRTSGHGKKTAFSDNGLQIQRSVGYKLTNAKLTRI